VVVVSTVSRLLREVGCLENLRLLEHLGFNRVRLELDVQTPLLDLLALGDHLVELLDGVDTVMGLLEQALTHHSDGLFVLTNLLRDADKHGELRRQVDVLALLLDFEEGLVHLHDLLVVLLLEVGGHRDGGASLTLLEVARLGAHVEAHIGHLVGLVVSVAGHDDGALEFIDYRLLEFLHLGLLVGVSEALLSEPIHLLINQLKAVVNRQIFADVIDDEVETALENPGGSEESGPGLHGVVEDLGLRSHEEARVAPDLAQVRVAHLSLDD